MNELRNVISSSLASFVLVLFTLASSWMTLVQTVDAIKNALYQGCQSVQSSTQSLLNLPERMGHQLGNRIREGIEASVRVAWHVLLFSLQFVHSAIADFIRKYLGTLLCTIDLLINLTVGTVQLVTDEAIAAVNAGIQQTLTELDQGLQEISRWILTDGQTALGTVAQALGASWTTVNTTALDLPQVRERLQSLAAALQIPNSLSATLQGLPTPSTQFLLNQTLTTLDQPFKFIESKLNETMGSISIPNIDWHVQLPIMELFVCQDSLKLDWVDEATNYLLTPLKWMMALVVLGMIGCMVSSVYVARWKAKSNVSPTDRVVATVYVWLRIPTHKFPRLQAYLKFIAHPASWVCFWTGVFGLTVIEIQLATLRSLLTLLQPDAWAKSLAQPLVDLSGSVASRANETVGAMNNHLGAMETTTNQLLFGWLADSLAEVNSTLTTVLQEAISGVETVFETVPFVKASVVGFVRCTLLNTWFDGMKLPKLSFPRISPDEVLIWMQMDMSNFTLGLAPDRLLAPYESKLKQDQAFYIILICLGLIVPILGLVLFCLPHRQVTHRTQQELQELLPPSPVSMLKKQLK